MSEKNYNYFYQKIKNDSSINEDEFFRFYNLTKKYDINLIQKIYPKNDFNKYFNILVNENINFDNEFEKKADYLEKITTINPSFIQYFIDLAKTEDFSESEKNLSLSRQAIKKGIENIEKTFNSNLFEKKDFKHILTKQGKELYPYIIKVLSYIRNIDLIAKKNSFGIDYNENNLFFMSMSYYRNILKSSLLLDFLKTNAINNDFIMDINFVNLDKIKENITLDKTNFGIISNIPNEDYLDFIHVSDNPYLIVCKPQKIKKYDELDYIFPEKINDENMKIMYHLVEKNVKIRANVIDLCIKIAEEGKCCFFTPEILVRDKIKSGKLAVVAKTPIEMKIKTCIVWNKHIALNNISIKFITLLKKILLEN